MMSVNYCRCSLLLSLTFSLLVHYSIGFAPATTSTCAAALQTRTQSTTISRPPNVDLGHTGGALHMSSSNDNNNNGGGGLLSLVGAVFIGGLFLGTSFLPMMDMGNGVAPLANSVATRDQAQQQVVTNDKYRLSRAAIQEKLNTVPVFYLVGSNGDMDTNIYLSYADAKDAAGRKVVKATTLDQIEYPLVLRRGRMRMAPPPVEIQKAEDALAESDKTFTLIPSKQALSDATDVKLSLDKNDLPLFVADRLAFASLNGGLQVPLFLEKQDCMTSYTRLRGTNQNLPEIPNIRATSLNDELFSMEKGTRPGMTQLAFYATAEDVNRAIELIGE